MIPGTLGHATIRKTRGLHWHNTKSDQIEQSMWLDGSSQDLSRSSFTLSSDGQKELIVSIWVKRLEFGRAQEIWILGNSSGITSYNDLIHANFNADDTLTFSIGNGGSSGGQIKPTRVFRDIGWYHLLFSYNSNTSIVNNLERLHLYVNGIKEGLLTTNTAVPDNQDVRGSLTGSADFRFGRNTHPSLNYYHKAYMAQACYLEGKSIQAGDFSVSDFLDTWPFGDNGSQFVPKKTSDISALASTVGGNSFCLDFADASAFGNDIANNNDFSDAGSPTAANQTTNTPSREYQTFNPLTHSQNSFTLTNGNTKANLASGGGFIPLTKLIQGNEKVYVEFVADDANNGNWSIGVADPSADQDAAVRQSGIIAWESDGDKYVDASQTATDVRAWTDGAVMALALDMGNRKLWIRDSTGWQGSGGSDDPTNSSTGVALPASIGDSALIIFGNSAGSHDQDCELKTEANSALTYAIPAGFKTLSTKDGTEPQYQGIDYFDSTLYEGNGGGQRVGDFVPFTDAFNVSKSIIFNDNDTAYLEWNSYSGTPTSGTDCTFSFWAKRGNLGSTQCIIFGGDASGSTWEIIRFESGDTFRVGQASSAYDLITTRTFKDTTQWYNFVVAFDTDNSTAADRIKIYVNGVRIEDSELSTSTDPSLGYVTNFNTGGTGEVIDIGFQGGGSNYFDGYLAQVVFIDGQALTPSSFGQTDTSTNRWIPKDVSGLTFGTNGYYLDMAIAPGTGNGPGNDVSGNNNDFAVTNLVAGDQSNDTPSNNHATLDSADIIGSATPTLSEGNLTYSGVDNGGRYVSGFPLTSGKWYWEIDVATTGTAFYPGFFTPAGVAFASTTPWNNNAGSFLIAPTAGHWLGTNGSGTTNVTSNYTAFISNGDRMFFAYDADNKYAYIGEVGSGGSGSTLTYYTLGGTASADPTNDSGFGAAPFGLNLTGEDTFYFGAVSGGTSVVANFLFDSTKWNGTPPTGYKALTQDNKDDTDDKITAWAWIKNRDSTDSHILVDRVRGVNKVMHTDVTDAETTEVNTIQRFLQRGVQIGNDVQVNTVNESYVLWQWLVGTSASTGSTTSPAGTIASTSIAADADHFSIVTFTGNQTSGATFGHGLGGAPEMVIVKERDPGGNNWMVGHDAVGWTKYLAWDTDAAAVTSSARWNDTEPSSTLVTLGNDTGINATGATYLAYCFRSVAGVCKVGSFIGNGSADGPYISTGFKPAWIMIKKIAAQASWAIYDSKRDPINASDEMLIAETNAAVNTGNNFDILSDGFKVRGTSGAYNTNGSEYLYLAMAEIAPNGAYPPIYGR